MADFTDNRGNQMRIDRPNGPGPREFGATVKINGHVFYLTEQHARDIRSVLEDLLDWDNSRRVKP